MGKKREETVLEVVSSSIRAEHLNQLSVLVGQSPTVLGPALAQLLPLVVRTLADQTEQPQGVDYVWNLIQQAQANQLLVQLDAMDVASWQQRGVLLLQGMLNGTYETNIQRLAAKAALPPTAYTPLVEVGVAAVLGALGKYTAEHNLQPTELSEWLQSEAHTTSKVGASKSRRRTSTSRSAASPQTAPPKPKQPVAPSFAAPAGKWQEVGGGSIFIPQPAAPAPKSNKRPLWLWPLLLLLSLGIGYGVFRWTTLKPQASTEASVPATTGTPTQPGVTARQASATVPATQVPAGRYDPATDTYIYHTGQPLVITLFNGTTLKVGSNSTEYRLYQFLADPTQQVDPLNAAADWINVDRVYFKAGAATLTANSGEQLRNLATILRTFPRAQLMFGAYTDSSSNSLENMRLSEARAQSAMRALITQGVPASRLQAVGYGEATPIASNNTPTGRALNRRLCIKVINELGPLPPTPAGVPQSVAPQLAGAAKPADSAGTKLLPLQTTAGQRAVLVEPAIQQEESDSRYQVAVQMAYLFDAPNKVQPTKQYLRKGDILYGEATRNGLVKISFWNPDSALATGWLKLTQLQKLSEDEAVTPTQKEPEPDSAEDTPSGADDSASTGTIP